MADSTRNDFARLALAGKLDPEGKYTLSTNVPAPIYQGAVLVASEMPGALVDGTLSKGVGALSRVVRRACAAEFAPEFDLEHWELAQAEALEAVRAATGARLGGGSGERMKALNDTIEKQSSTIERLMALLEKQGITLDDDDAA